MAATRPRNSSSSSLAHAGVRRPFWLPGPAYYFLALVICAVTVLAVWGILQEGEEAFAIWFGVSAGISVFFFAVVVREVFLRRARNRYLLLRRQLDDTILNARIQNRTGQQNFKISQKQNADLVARIKKKSDAAKELGGISKGHLEVFELCGEYLVLNKEQIENANPGSPRLGDLRQGRDFVKRLHHYHLLTWAQIESTALTAAAADCDTLDGKFRSARGALEVLESALRHYPSDTALRDSELAIKEFISSLQIKNWIEIADKQTSVGDYSGAELTLGQALNYVEDVRSVVSEKDLVIDRLKSEMHRLSVHSQPGMEGEEMYRPRSEDD